MMAVRRDSSPLSPLSITEARRRGRLCALGCPDKDSLSLQNNYLVSTTGTVFLVY